MAPSKLAYLKSELVQEELLKSVPQNLVYAKFLFSSLAFDRSYPDKLLKLLILKASVLVKLFIVVTKIESKLG